MPAPRGGVEAAEAGLPARPLLLLAGGELPVDEGHDSGVGRAGVLVGGDDLVAGGGERLRLLLAERPPAAGRLSAGRRGGGGGHRARLQEPPSVDGIGIVHSLPSRTPAPYRPDRPRGNRQDAPCPRPREASRTGIASARQSSSNMDQMTFSQKSPTGRRGAAGEPPWPSRRSSSQGPPPRFTPRISPRARTWSPRSGRTPSRSPTPTTPASCCSRAPSPSRTPRAGSACRWSPTTARSGSSAARRTCSPRCPTASARSRAGCSRRTGRSTARASSTPSSASP